MHPGRLNIVHSRAIATMKKLDKFNIPHFKMLDGTGDSVEHSVYFQHKLEFETDDERLFCKNFPLNLTGVVLA